MNAGKDGAGRIPALDWVRTVSAFGVILLHCSSLFVARPSRWAVLGVTPALLCNQAVRFSVPVFFLLSGLSLGLGGKPPKLPQFWLRRLWRVGVPYVLWSGFYFLLDRRLDLRVFMDADALRVFGRFLLTGGAASHLWFIPVLLQLYLLYPGLMWLRQRAPALMLSASFLISLTCTLLLLLPSPLTPWWRARLWRWFPTWLFYFVLGMALTRSRLESIAAFAGKHPVPLLLAAAAASLLYSWDAGRSGNLDSIKPQLFLYGPLCFLAAFASWDRLSRLPALARFSSFAARHSMAIFFSHICFLRLLRQQSFFNRNALTMLLTFAAVSALALLIAALSGLAGDLLKRVRTKQT